MKTLHLIRHAKSSWGTSSQSDAQRPLNDRGIKATEIMAQRIMNAGCSFQNTHVSMAIRAQMTIQGIADELPHHELQWTVDEDLYTFNARTLLKWIHKFDDAKDSLVIVAHNPGLTELANHLGGLFIDNLPTCSYIQLQFEADYWMELTAESGKQTEFLKPKMF